MGKKIWMFAITLILIILLVFGGVYAYKSLTPKKTYTNSNPTPTVNVTYTNFASVLEENPIVQALPDNAILEVRFYNFDSGSRVFEKSFTMKKSSVVEGVEPADITITIHSKYLKELTNKNFCDIIQKAKSNGDMGTETTLSPMALAWKFKSMMSYKSCLGL